MAPNSQSDLVLNQKLAPLPFAGAGWTPHEGTLDFVWGKNEKATLQIPLIPEQTWYLTAEVSALPHPQHCLPQEISITANGQSIGTWFLDSTTIHDKMVIIPSSAVNKECPCNLAFSLKPGFQPQPSGQQLGMRLHTITLSTTLDAYLKELQTGYDWVCSVRDSIVETVGKVLFYLEGHEHEYGQAIEKLKTIVNDPYVLQNHRQQLVFDEKYFHSLFTILKEGTIHAEIRDWVQRLQQLESAIIEIGNHATRRTDLRCFSPDELEKLVDSSLEYTNQIDEIRSLNETLNNLEIILGKTALNSVPSTLYLDITNTCNFRCRMCYQSKNNFLQTSLINRHLAEVISMMPYLSSITIAGLGEPLLGRNLDQFAAAANRLQCSTCLITNGSLIKKNIDFLKNFSRVSISFDGATKETFETIRHRSNFLQVCENIRLLREQAPNLTIELSVVVSRANLDELSHIVKLAGQLGVNQINMTPMEHIQELELKCSDKPLFDQELALALEVAKTSGITIVNSVLPATFSSTENTQRNKKNLLRFINTLSTREEQTYKLEALLEKLTACEFAYYPNPIVFGRSEWPHVKNFHQEKYIPKNPDVRNLPPSFNQVAELSQIQEKIDHLLAEIKKNQKKEYSLPYCLDPWKLNYVKSNGKNRLCCHADIVTGNLGDDGFHHALNSPEQIRIRKSMLKEENRLPVCVKCRAADRFMRLESVERTCKQFNISLTKPPTLSNG